MSAGSPSMTAKSKMSRGVPIARSCCTLHITALAAGACAVSGPDAGAAGAAPGIGGVPNRRVCISCVQWWRRVLTVPFSDSSTQVHPPGYCIPVPRLLR